MQNGKCGMQKKKGVEQNFSALAHATIILANVILKTEEIYLVNHIKLYLKNHPAVEERERSRNLQQEQQKAAHWLLDGPSTSTAAARAAASAFGSAATSSGSISEINYFAKVLCEKLEKCLDAVTGSAKTTTTTSNACGDVAYSLLVSRFVAALHEVCCRSRHKEALQSVFRLLLAESALLDKYCNFLTMDQQQTEKRGAYVGARTEAGIVDDNSSIQPPVSCVLAATWQALQLQLEVLKLLSAMKLLDPVVMLQLLKQQKQRAYQQQRGGQRELQMVTNKERVKGYDNMQRTLLSEICQQNSDARDWSVQQVRQLLESGGGAVLNFLITENFAFISDLCEVAAGEVETSGAVWLNALLQHANALNKHTIYALPPFLLNLCNASCINENYDVEVVLLSLQLLHRLHSRSKNSRALQVRLERVARRLVFNCSSAMVKRQQLLKQLRELAGERLTAKEEDGSSSTFWQQLLLDTPEYKLAAQPLAEQKQEEQQQQQQHQQQRIIDEKWLLSQLIKFSAQSDYGAEQISRILLEIQSEQKLYKIFNSSEFAVARVLRHAIRSSMEAMLAAFRNNCVQHNPHIHYMQPNPLVRVALAVLMTRISTEIATSNNSAYNRNLPIMTMVAPADATPSLEEMELEVSSSAGAPQGNVLSADGLYLCDAVTTLLECIKTVEDKALLYIESRFIEKFVREQVLRVEHVATLLGFLDWCCVQARQQLLQQQQQQHHSSDQQRSVLCLLQCIAALLQQRFIWTELNQMEKPSTATATTTGMGDAAPSIGSLLTPQQRNLLLCRVLDVLVVAARQSLQHTIFYKHYKQLAAATSGVGGVGEELIDSVTENIFNDLSAAVAADKLEANTLLQHSRDNIAEVNDVAVGRLLQAYAPQAVFIAKLIEVHANEGMNSGAVSLSASYLTGTAGKGGSSLNNVGGGALGGSGGGVGMSSVGASAVGVAAANGTQGVFDEGSGANGIQIPMDILSLIGVSVLRTHQFYAYAVTPFEIIQQQQREQRIDQLSPAKRAGQTSQATSSAAATSAAASGKLPTIPVESLSDVDILRKFVKSFVDSEDENSWLHLIGGSLRVKWGKNGTRALLPRYPLYTEIVANVSCQCTTIYGILFLWGLPKIEEAWTGQIGKLSRARLYRQELSYKKKKKNFNKDI
ncbi:unnamed protein product [Ceratitis capitata]|uniref:(Mediterranean fruit fly) hypothetical protein n=1 Tax=Ceratitis capitata TaxID=7213 RepID=A0A811U1S9_CERCA|nr:unnamed protein product [Ceratitis capitata]